MCLADEPHESSIASFPQDFLVACFHLEGSMRITSGIGTLLLLLATSCAEPTAPLPEPSGRPLAAESSSPPPVTAEPSPPSPPAQVATEQPAATPAPPAAPPAPPL